MPWVFASTFLRNKTLASRMVKDIEFVVSPLSTCACNSNQFGECDTYYTCLWIYYRSYRYITDISFFLFLRIYNRYIELIICTCKNIYSVLHEKHLWCVNLCTLTKTYSSYMHVSRRKKMSSLFVNCGTWRKFASILMCFVLKCS